MQILERTGRMLVRVGRFLQGERPYIINLDESYITEITRPVEVREISDFLAAWSDNRLERLAGAMKSYKGIFQYHLVEGQDKQEASHYWRNQIHDGGLRLEAQLWRISEQRVNNNPRQLYADLQRSTGLTAVDLAVIYRLEYLYKVSLVPESIVPIIPALKWSVDLYRRYRPHYYHSGEPESIWYRK